MDSAHITRAELKLIPYSLKGGYQWMFLTVSQASYKSSVSPISSFSRRAKHLTVGPLSQEPQASSFP